MDTIIASLLMVLIVVIASVMVFTYATGLFSALLVPPKTATEAISLEYASFSSNSKTASLFVRNTGSTPITLTAYYVMDSSGNQYAKTNWAVAVFSPLAIANSTGGGLTILISTACTGCTTTGQSFTFQQGNSYTITLITTKNAQFTFSVVR